MNQTIIHEDDGKWYFWDETWADRYGPYESREIAESSFERYCKEVLFVEYNKSKIIETYTINP